MPIEANTCRTYINNMLQSATGEELDALLPSVLDRAFKGELCPPPPSAPPPNTTLKV